MMKFSFPSFVGACSLFLAGFIVASLPQILLADEAGSGEGPVLHRIDGTMTPRIVVTPGEHYFIKTPPNVDVTAEVAFGDPLARAVAEFYVYRYSGNERANAAAGRTGNALFDGAFTLSRTLYQHADPDTRVVHTAAHALAPSTYYYLRVMPLTEVSVPFIVGFTDTDGDGWTDVAEDRNGNGVMDSDETNPLLADTDGDTVSDGLERMLSLRLERAPHAPVLDPLRSDGTADADAFTDWLSAGVICVPNASDGDGDPFFDVNSVRIDAGCMPPVSVRCKEGVCDGG